MSPEVHRVFDRLAVELFRQGNFRNSANPRAPLVLDRIGGDVIEVYGEVNLRELAEAALRD